MQANNVFLRGFVYLIIFTVTAIIAVTVFISSVGVSTLSNSIDPYLSSYINLALPERFGFFTKSPNEENIKFYEFKNKKVIEINLRANNYSNLYGLKRDSRRVGYELGVIIRQIPENNWENIDSDEFSKFNFSKLKPFEIKDSKITIEKIDKGKYIFYYYEPVSWELQKYQKKTYGKFAFIEIK